MMVYIGECVTVIILGHRKGHKFPKKCDDNNKYLCYACGSKKSTLNKTGCMIWIMNYDKDQNMLCMSCWFRIIYRPIKGYKRYYKDKNKYVCYACGSHRSVKNEHGHYKWILNYDSNCNMLCWSCYKKYIWSPINIDKIRKYQKRANSKISKRKMFFKPLNKHVVFKTSPKIGVCNWCRAVVGVDCKTTHIHHDNDMYDLTNPLKNGIEICAKCHLQIRDEIKYYKSYPLQPILYCKV